MENILDHNTNLNEFKIIQVIQNMSSDHSGIKLEINYRNTSGNHQVFGNQITHF